jgi:hypothetical protein
MTDGWRPLLTTLPLVLGMMAGTYMVTGPPWKALAYTLGALAVDCWCYRRWRP